MGKKVTYTLTDEALEILIKNWDKAEDYSRQWLSILEDSISELRRFNKERTPLTEKWKAYIDNSVVSIIRRNMSPYTTKAQAYINQFDATPDITLVSKDYFERLREINLSAMAWHKKFNATVKEYQVEQQLYKLSFIGENGVLDFLGYLNS